MNTSSYSSSSGVYLGGDSSGGGEGGGSYIDGEGYGGGGGSGYLVSSVSKVRSSSSGGARRVQTAGSTGGLSPAFRERKTTSSRSGGYDGEILLVKQSGTRVLFLFLLSYCVFLGSSSANSSPEFTRKDYGNYCK